MARAYVLALLFVWLSPNFLSATVNNARKAHNILMIVSDEEGAIPFGWEDELAPWYKENLPGRQLLKENGVVFEKHYVYATACVPSRGVAYTGYDPKISGLTQTNGFAKPWDDPKMTWLEPNQVPTIGNWLLASGKYSEEKVAYFGKFHLADVDIRDEFGRLKQTLTPKFKPVQENIDLYIKENLLAPYGFSNGWVGPEPHGPQLENSGEYRDPIYVNEVKAFFARQAELKLAGNDEPFVAFVNLVNPHDIVLAWALKLAGKYNADPSAPIPPVCEETDHIDLSKEASVHAEYQKTYKKMYCWDWVMNKLYDGDKNLAKLRQFYYDLIKKSDQSIMHIVNALKQEGLFDDTIIIFTADHGDYLGRRKQQQKWHGLYNEVTHVPFTVSGPGIEAASIKPFTSHIDIVPTILGIAGIDVETTRRKLLAQFEKAPPLLGRDLSSLIYREDKPDFNRIIYSRTEDDISHGKNKYAATWYNLLPSWLIPWIPGGGFQKITGSRFVESIRYYDDERTEWSFMRYYDPEGITPEEYRLYNVTRDGFEVQNLSEEHPEKVAECLATMEFFRGYYQN